MWTRKFQWQLLLALGWLTCLSNAKLTFSFQPSPMILFTGRHLSVNLTVNASAPVPRGTIRFALKDARVARLPFFNETSYQWSGNTTTLDVQQFQLTIQGVRLGWTDLLISFHDSENASQPHFLVKDKEQVAVLQIPNPLQTVYRILLITFVVILVFGMGCTIDMNVVISLLKRPVGLAVGWFTQFVLMPHLGLGIGQILLLLVNDLDNASAFACGILTLACSPGGGSSNMWTLMFDGDLDLSMTMTFVSQLCAMFMMPLWLFAYSRFYIDGNARIPFDQVALNLLQLVIPVTLGVLLKLKWPKIAYRVSRCIKPFALLFILFVVIFGTYLNWYLFELIVQLPIVIPFAALLPWLGFLFGYIVAFVLRLGRKQAVAIALEAGIQNVGIPIQVLQFSMPQPEGSLAGIVPLIVVIITPMPLYILLAIKKIRERLNRDRQYEMEGQQEGDGTEVSAYSANSDAFRAEGLKSGLSIDLSDSGAAIQHTKSTENLVPLERKL